MRERQTLTTIDILEKMEPVLKSEKPDIVLVHGVLCSYFAPTEQKKMKFIKKEKCF